MNIALLVLAAVLAAATFDSAFAALGRPGRQLGGVPAGMLFFMATVVSLAAIGDVRMIRAGGIRGTRRLARHLWRMCFGLFIAAGSFAAQLGRVKFIPQPIRMASLVALGLLPLVLLLYWMWRVRLRNNVRGLMERPRPASALGAVR